MISKKYYPATTFNQDNRFHVGNFDSSFENIFITPFTHKLKSKSDLKERLDQ